MATLLVAITIRLRFANGDPAAFLDLAVFQPPPALSADPARRLVWTGRTDAAGQADSTAVVTLPPVGPNFVVPLTLRVRDAFGNSFETSYRAGVLVTLPAIFDPLPSQAASNPRPAAGTYAQFADQAVKSVMPLVSDNAPGYVFMIRKNGAPWISVTRGLSRVAADGVSPRAMTNDTIIITASMSKPVTAAAFVAMIDDWTDIQAAVAAIGKGGPTTPLEVKSVSTGHITTVSVPPVLLPLFSQPAHAQAFRDNLPPKTSDAVRKALTAVASGTAVAAGPPAAPPGHFGLLRRVIAGKAVPAYTDAALPLIQERLGPGPYDAQASVVTIEQFLLHESGFVDGMFTRDSDEPPGDRARFDYRALVHTLMQTTPLPPFPPPQRSFRYSNCNYDVMTVIIEACTETTFDDYLSRRLFLDPRFDCIERHVVDTRRGALYYNGTRPIWTGGVLFSDYTDWTGNGGLYVTGNQFTDWLHALYARQPLARVGAAAAPLVSAAGHAALFSDKPYFTVGWRRPAGPTGASFRFQENGGVTGTGCINGNLAIIVAPGGTVYAAFYDANGNVPADPPFEAVVAALPWDDAPDPPRPIPRPWTPPQPRPRPP